MEEIDFLLYQPPTLIVEPPRDGRVTVNPLWLEAMQLLDEDLHQLLQMDHQNFWCQVMN